MNKFRIKIALICLIALNSCNQFGSKSGILDTEKMAKVMADLQIAEASVNRIQSGSYDSTQVVFKYLKEKIFKKYGTDSAAFSKSFDYYSKDKEQLINVYSRVEEILLKQRKK